MLRRFARPRSPRYFSLVFFPLPSLSFSLSPPPPPPPLFTASIYHAAHFIRGISNSDDFDNFEPIGNDGCGTRREKESITWNDFILRFEHFQRWNEFMYVTSIKMFYRWIMNHQRYWTSNILSPIFYIDTLYYYLTSFDTLFKSLSSFKYILQLKKN